MIITFIFNLIALLVNMFAALFSFLLGWTFPTGLQEAVTWVFSPLSFLGSFIDISYFGIMVNCLFGFLIMFFTYLVIRYGWTAITGRAPKFTGDVEYPDGV